MPNTLQTHIKENVLGREDISPELKIAYRRTFGIAIVQLEVGDKDFDLERTINQFDGQIKSFETTKDLEADQAEQLNKDDDTESIGDIPKYTMEYMEEKDLILKQRFIH